MASAAPFSFSGTSRRKRTISIAGLRVPSLLARRAAIDHHHRLAFEHGLAVDSAVAGERGAALVGIEAGDAKRGHDLVADIDRRLELHALGQIDAARARKLGPEHGREDRKSTCLNSSHLGISY